MGANKYSPNDQTKEYFLKSKGELIQLHKIMQSTIDIYSDENKLITLSIDNAQTIHSINLSDNLLCSFNHKDICNRIIRLINQAIFNSNINGINEAKNAISLKELEKIISNESQGIKDNLDSLNKHIERSRQELSLKTKSVVSEGGNIKIVISGSRMILSLSISDEYLSEKNKSMIETEIMATLNKAMREIQEEIREVMKINEEEFKNNLA
jgi:DNA-binding protein YbaB